MSNTPSFRLHVGQIKAHLGNQVRISDSHGPFIASGFQGCPSHCRCFVQQMCLLVVEQSPRLNRHRRDRRCHDTNSVELRHCPHGILETHEFDQTGKNQNNPFARNNYMLEIKMWTRTLMWQHQYQQRKPRPVGDQTVHRWPRWLALHQSWNGQWGLNKEL